MDKAYIYAAGRGMRLGDSYSDQQKIMIDVGGKSLLEWHLIRLQEAGVMGVAVITGYQPDLIRRTCSDYAERTGFPVDIIHNSDFREGSALSLWASLEDILKQPNEVLLMDGDVFYPGLFLSRLLNSEQRTCLLIDRHYSTQDDDPVLVPIMGGRPLEFRKKWTGKAEVVGESIGFFKINRDHFNSLEKETLLRTMGIRREESYDEIIRGMVQSGLFGFEDVTGLPWTELDFPEDVEYARNEIYPKIQKMECSHP